MGAGVVPTVGRNDGVLLGLGVRWELGLLHRLVAVMVVPAKGTVIPQKARQWIASPHLVLDLPCQLGPLPRFRGREMSEGQQAPLETCSGNLQQNIGREKKTNRGLGTVQDIGWNGKGYTPTFRFNQPDSS